MKDEYNPKSEKKYIKRAFKKSEYVSALPELPKKLDKIEADCTPRVLAWFKKYHKGSCAIEIKATRENTIPESALLPHQRAALLAAETTNGIIHKISDAGHTRNPFDAFFLSRVQGYVVAAFVSHGVALVIPIRDWQGADIHKTSPRYRVSLSNATGLL